MIAVCLLAVLAGCVAEALAVENGAGSHALPEGSLYQVDSRWQRDVGGTMKLEDLRGKVRVVSMFFGGCDNLCPMLLAQLKSVEQGMPASLREKVGFVLVTMDSKDDTLAALRAFRMKSGLSADHWTLLRGTADDTRELASLLGVRYAPKMDGGQMGHTGLIAILDREGRMISHVPSITDPGAFSEDLSRAASSIP